MDMIDRFTRDKVSRFVWGGLAIGCLVMLIFAGRGEPRSLEEEVDAARERSLSYVSGVMVGQVTAAPGSSELDFYYRDLYTALRGSVFAPDPTVARVRLFDANSILLMTTDDPRRVRSVQVDDPDVAAALEGTIGSKTVVQAFSLGTSGPGGDDVELLQTFVPLRMPDRIGPAGVVQIDYFMDRLRTEAEGPWPELMWTFGILSILCLGMTALSLRAPSQTVGAGLKTLERVNGVRKEADDADAQGSQDAAVRARAAELEREAASLREEAEASHERLRQAEEAYRYLENRMHEVKEQLAQREGQEPAAVDDRVLSLEEALRKSEAEITLLRASSSDPDQRAALEGAEARLAQAEARAQEMEERLQQAFTEASQEIEGTVDPALLALLEERLDAAERRAEEAERKLSAPLSEGPMSSEASDLRSRLARTAARKKLGADEAAVAAHAASAAATGSVGASTPGAADAVTELQSALASELRGPLNSILGLSLSLKGLVESGEGEDMVRDLGLNAKKLEQLIADLSDAKKIAEGKLQLDRRKSDLDAIVSRIVHEASGLENRDVAVSAENVAASVDPVRIQQILDALLANAVDRTAPGETIRVKLTASDQTATIAVEDDSSAAPEIGYGLVLATKLAELHGGSIDAAAREGGGGVFRLVLPLA